MWRLENGRSVTVDLPFLTGTEVIAAVGPEKGDGQNDSLYVADESGPRWYDPDGLALVVTRENHLAVWTAPDTAHGVLGALLTTK